MDNVELVKYSRQEAMDRVLRFSDARKANVTNIIIGCGGVGFWTGLFLAMSGFKRFILIEGDKLDDTNLARIPVPQTWIGRNKAIALRRIIHQLRPTANVRVYAQHITDENMRILTRLVNTERPVVVYDNTDDARIQAKIYKAVKPILEGDANRVEYYKFAYEGFKVGTYNNSNVWVDEANYTPGYRTTMANAMSSALAASVGLFSVSMRHMTTADNTDLTLDFEKIIRGE